MVQIVMLYDAETRTLGGKQTNDLLAIEMDFLQRAARNQERRKLGISKLKKL